jgi:gamma-glutamylaminecyclotransferase
MEEVVAMSQEKTLLFIYGTLKRGQRNHHLIADQDFLGEVVTEPRYRVIDLGPYPALIVDAARGLAVKGELWEVSPRCLTALDEFEGVSGPFNRVPVAIPGRDLVQAYFWNRTVSGGGRSGDQWPLAGVERPGSGA